jgi:hypothetical protein
VNRLHAPAPLPRIEQQEARQFTSDFWHGIALGAVIGAALLVFVLAGLGRLAS